MLDFDNLNVYKELGIVVYRIEDFVYIVFLMYSFEM